MNKNDQMFDDASWLLKAIEKHNPNVSVYLAHSVRSDLKVKYIEGQPLAKVTIQKINTN